MVSTNSVMPGAFLRMESKLELELNLKSLKHKLIEIPTSLRTLLNDVNVIREK